MIIVSQSNVIRRDPSFMFRRTVKLAIAVSIVVGSAIAVYAASNKNVEIPDGIFTGSLAWAVIGILILIAAMNWLTDELSYIGALVGSIAVIMMVPFATIIVGLVLCVIGAIVYAILMSAYEFLLALGNLLA